MSRWPGHKMAETDPELGANCMVFFFRDWRELLEVPDLDRLVPDLGPLVERLVAADANQYRIFRFEEDGAIRAAFVFLRMDTELSKVPAEDPGAQPGGADRSVVVRHRVSHCVAAGHVAGEATILRPDIAGLIRAAYDPVLPGAAQDASHALRLFARLEQPQ